MKKVHRWVAALGIAALAAAAWWWQNRTAPLAPAEPPVDKAGAPRAAGGGPGRPAGPGGPAGPVSVEVGKVETTTLEDDAQAVGSLRSKQGVMLRPEVSGNY